MTHDTALRVILAFLSALLYFNHVGHGRRFQRSERTGGFSEVIMIAAACLWTISLLVYLLGPKWLDFRLPLPDLVRWTGVAGMTLCLPLSVWVYRTLGAHFSMKLELLKDHQLVMHGPYRFVRHPMYSTLFLCVLSTSLISADLVVVAASAVLVIATSFRIKKEEAMLRQRFRKTHRRYMRETGAVLPRLR